MTPSGLPRPSIVASAAIQENVKINTDSSLGMSWTEATCGRFHGSLSHVFDDGPPPGFLGDLPGSYLYWPK
jgi:peptide methionine sulfoxide reductase MsrB